MGRGGGLWTGLALGALANGMACSDGGGMDTVDAGAADAGMPGDNNDSFDDAVPVDVDGPPLPGVIDTPGDQDFFVFEGEAGQWLEISALPDDFQSDLFPIVTLYDSGQTQVAEGFILATRLPAAGIYYIRVEHDPLLGGSSVGGPDEIYTFSLIELTDGVPDYTFDAELGDDAASAVSVPTGSFFFADLLGLYDHAGDRDVFSLQLSGPGTKWVNAGGVPPGPNSNGSTSDYNAIWITDATGDEILARIDTTQFGLNPPLPSPATYLVWVEKDGTPAGENDFYDVSMFGGFDDDPPEKETLEAPGTNDTIALADASNEVIFVGADRTYFLAYLPEGDVDYIGFDVTDSVAIEAWCMSWHAGSGLIGMSAEIRDASDAVLATGTEPGYVILDTTLPSAGRYYFRLTASGQDPEVTGNWVRCAIGVPSL